MYQKNLKVFITRTPYDYIGSEISISKITGVKWDSISGGINRKQSGYSLYGYIDYKLAAKLVNCSGRHNKYEDNQAKICIPAKSNESYEYKDGYKALCKKAGPKPQSQVSLSRPTGYPPCTKYILQILDSNPTITRKELRDRIINNGYLPTTFRSAIKSLEKQDKIILIGNPCSKNQQIQKKSF